MFGFFRKKVNRQQIKAFEGALKAINIFIVLSEWTKAKKAIEEIEYKEKKSLTITLEKLEKEKISDWGLENDLQRKNLTEDLKAKVKKLEKLTLLLNKKEEIYNEKIKKERFKIRFHKMRTEINLLIWNNSNDHAIWLVQKFLEENPDSTQVIKFYNKEKKKILKNIERLRKKEELSGKKNAQEEAMNLIWEVWNIEWKKDKDKDDENVSFFEKWKDILNLYKSIKERLRRKQLLDEINMLIEEDSKINNDVAEKKLANLHKWLVKEVSEDEMEWYDIYWKIIWNNKIIGDTFGYVENKSKYNFFIWDATWKWIRAWFIITLLSRIFNKYVKSKDLQNLTYTINNWLKQDLKLSNFITWVFFEIEKYDIWRIKYVWMWHEPMLFFKKSESSVDRIIPWGLAAWIRLIKNLTEIKVKHKDLDEWDSILMYSSSIIESKNAEWESYWLNRLKAAYIQVSQTEDSIKNIYDHIIRNVKEHMWEEQFTDDASILIVKRNTKKDIMDDSDYLKELKAKEWLTNQDIKKLKWKTLEYIDKELIKIKKRKETKRIVKILENLYYTWEVLKLKQEAIRYIKEWFIDKKINKYLKKAINKEKSYKINQKNQKMSSRFNVLEQLLKKWDFKTVISEAEMIIWNDWEK